MRNHASKRARRAMPAVALLAMSLAPAMASADESCPIPIDWLEGTRRSSRHLTCPSRRSTGSSHHGEHGHFGRRETRGRASKYAAEWHHRRGLSAAGSIKLRALTSHAAPRGLHIGSICRPEPRGQTGSAGIPTRPSKESTPCLALSPRSCSSSYGYGWHPFGFGFGSARSSPTSSETPCATRRPGDADRGGHRPRHRPGAAAAPRPAAGQRTGSRSPGRLAAEAGPSGPLRHGPSATA